MRIFATEIRKDFLNKYHSSPRHDTATLISKMYKIVLKIDLHK